jgi:phytanoyl-CoA hydroxylase
MKKILLTETQLKQYRENGFLIIPGFLSQEIMGKLQQVAFEDAVIRKHAFDLNDQGGKKTKLTLWYQPGEDAYGLLTRSSSLVNAVNQLMEGESEVCHFHSKLMQKEPRIGGAWEWHQDYGYWYKNEFLFPDQMISVMIAITDASKENGCLQVIRGSHKMGRIEHGFAGEQVGASQHYVDLALQQMELVYVEIKAGDALFFHPNLLHRSEDNRSEHARWSLISVYNRSSNIPFNEPSKTATVPVQVVPDEVLLADNLQGITDNDSFLQKEKDEALK